jgi:hypothetical protein
LPNALIEAVAGRIVERIFGVNLDGNGILSIVIQKLSKTNPYMRNAALRERTVFRSVATSSAVEDIRAPFKEMDREAAKSESSGPESRRRASR